MNVKCEPGGGAYCETLIICYTKKRAHQPKGSFLALEFVAEGSSAAACDYASFYLEVPWMPQRALRRLAQLSGAPDDELALRPMPTDVSDASIDFNASDLSDF